MSVPNTKCCEIINVHSPETASTGSGSPSSMLARTATLEVRRLSLTKGRQIPTHHAPGEITVHCLEGRINFTADGAPHELGAGQLLVLAAGVPHSVAGLEDSVVLVTKVLPGGSATP